MASILQWTSCSRVAQVSQHRFSCHRDVLLLNGSMFGNKFDLREIVRCFSVAKTAVGVSDGGGSSSSQKQEISGVSVRSANRYYLVASKSRFRVEARAAPTAEGVAVESTAGHVVDNARYFSSDDRPIVLFDGVCNLCNGGVNFVLDNDPHGKVRFAALQSQAGRELLLRSGRSPDDISSIILVEKDRSYIKSEAILRIAQYLEMPLPPLGSLGLLAPLFLRDFVYDNVANNRYSLLGKRDVCRLSDDGFMSRFIE